MSDAGSDADTRYATTSALKKAMFHAWTAQRWAPGFFGFSGDAKIWNFHTQASILYQFRASRGLPHDDLDHDVGVCMEHGTYNLRVERYGGVEIVPRDFPVGFSIGDSKLKDWRGFEFLGGKKKAEKGVEK